VVDGELHQTAEHEQTFEAVGAIVMTVGEGVMRITRAA
jgi:hypothetical protein